MASRMSERPQATVTRERLRASNHSQQRDLPSVTFHTR